MGKPTNGVADKSVPQASQPSRTVQPGDVLDYWTDALQRTVLFWDVMRERGNEYISHEQSGKPPVLVFDYQIILDARKFARPANYALAAIVPPDDCVPTDMTRRPFVVIDPRAGHGPGIGGFKMDSEIGIALRAGHPCYFVMFFPQPVEGQTIECVTLAERKFLDAVNKRHPSAPGKPFVIGNCQGGWALMLVAALQPESVGPILLAGTPLSYWAGVDGKNPMRYMGGLQGGTWAASLAGDLGNGKFDGAHLVNNFEKLDPGNSFWSKLYHLYSEVDGERERFLEFERWWGGHFMLNKQEMEWIAQNLFVGNRLAQGKVTIDDEQVDLRNIRSPIIVFASWGDNITPPQQALNWIPDLYDNVEQIRQNEQTIVYFLHEQIGHLGIFVSAGVANREHSEFVSALDLIDVLPPGLYEAIITDTTPETPGITIDDRHVIRFEPRQISDILALGDGRKGEQAFEVVRHVAQVNQAMYDRMMSPVVQMFSNEMSATLLRNLNPSRLERTMFSDSNPVMKAVKPLAALTRAQRHRIAPDNPLLKAERQFARSVRDGWDHYRDVRDQGFETLFRTIYDSPWIAALTGFTPEPRHRNAPGNNHRLLEQRAELENWYEQGSVESGFMRLLIYVANSNGVVDERPFNGIKRLMHDAGLDISMNLGALKQMIRHQTFVVRTDEMRALQGLKKLLPTKAQRQHALDTATGLLALSGPISAAKQERLLQVANVLGLSATPARKPVARRPRSAPPAKVAAPAKRRSAPAAKR